ncbi:MAG: dTDP-4-dehydrorhamnose reductase [Aggregatilineales bacterium]
MQIVVTGAGGLLGRRVMAELATRGHTTLGLTHAAFDITDFEAVRRVVGEAKPDLIIHCAAMTHVDQCAEQPDEAVRVNGFGTQNIALACQQHGAALAYLSSNEVFDGERAFPYLEYDATHPVNPYGYSKWVGEQAVRDLLPRHYVIRTSWLFAHGGDNFLHRLVKAAARGEPLSVVTNEVAAPTYAEDLAEALARVVETGRYGIYHLVNAGSASRFQFARHLLDCAGYADVPITPIIGAQRPRPSRPPTYCVLRNFAAAQLGITLRPWQEAVSAFFARERAQVLAP